jgi:protein-tyrosine phosphatase
MPSGFERAVTAVVRHPVAMAVKGALRDLRWRLRRPELAAGDLPAPPLTLVFVCKGNICRSPFAARYAERRLRERGVAGVVCVSAGYAATQAAASPPHAIAAARAYGVDLSMHRPRAFAGADADVDASVVVMEAAHLDVLAGALGVPRSRLVLLPRFAPEALVGRGYRRDNIEDPFGRSLADFERCYAQTSAAVDGLVERLHDAARGGASRPVNASAGPSAAPARADR